jgi:hypothetical protein
MEVTSGFTLVTHSVRGSSYIERERERWIGRKISEY